MKKSRYFGDLAESYNSEIDDLLSNSEGKTVLQSRLKEKRDAFKALLPMIEFAPEMVAAAFYDAFAFKDGAMLNRAVLSEPGRGSFPSWKQVAGTLTIAAWAQPLIAAALTEEAGERFLVSAAALEFLRLKDSGAPMPAESDDEEHHNGADDDGDDDESRDLAEAGSDWMATQGFDALDS